MLRILDRLEEWLIATLMAAATLVIFAAVLHRYGSGVPILQDYLLKINMSWAQELCIFMFIWMAKFGAAYGVRTGIHVGVDVLVNAVNPRWRSRLIVFSLLAGALFTALVGTYGVIFVHRLMPTEQVSADLEWPMWIVYLCIPIGSYLMCFRFLQSVYLFLKTGHVARVDHAHVEGIDMDTDPEIAAIDADKNIRMGGKE
ncbi:MAG: TRAP transporter small permease [Rhodospirillales bacterium]|nr:TRAP transporter small permease [Rhodospirillales bacterium]